MVRAFYLRLLAVFFSLLGFSILVASFAILPSYILASLKINLANEKLAMLKATPLPEVDQKTVSQIADLDGKLTLIENAEKNKYLISEKVINEVIFKKMPVIKITEISYQQDSIAGKTIKVHGTAPSRAALLLFRQALENDNAFKKVDLPISNFVKGADISFYLSLIPA